MIKIRYTDSLENLTPDQFGGGFFDGWPDPPSPETHWRILQGSYAVMLAAFIPLLEVLPAYKGKGIGTALTRRLLEKLSHLYSIDLMCDANMQPFYQRLGMQPYTGMVYRNYDRQAGNGD